MLWLNARGEREGERRRSLFFRRELGCPIDILRPKYPKLYSLFRSGFSVSLVRLGSIAQQSPLFVVTYFRVTYILFRYIISTYVMLFRDTKRSPSNVLLIRKLFLRHERGEKGLFKPQNTVWRDKWVDIVVLKSVLPSLSFSLFWELANIFANARREKKCKFQAFFASMYM